MRQNELHLRPNYPQPPSIVLAVLVAVALSQGGWLWSDPVSSKTEEGKELLTQQQFGDALSRFRDAQVDAPQHPVLAYNAGLALMGQRKFAEAIDEFDTALRLSEDPAVQADAYYNRGLAQFQNQDLQEAVQSFIKTLEIRPDDEQAKHNIELIRRKIAEQAQQNQDQNQDSQQQQDQQQEQSEQQQSDQQQQQQNQEQSDDSQQQQRQEQQNQDQQQGDEEPTPQAQPGEEESEGTPTPQQAEAEPTPGEYGQSEEEQAAEQAENEPQNGQSPEAQQTPQTITLTPEQARQLLEALDENADLQERLQRLRRDPNRKERYW